VQERVEKALADDNKLLVISENDGQIVSMSDIQAGERKRAAHVGQIGISILPEFRGMGLGTALMETMIEWAQRHPVIEKLALGVWAKNELAIRLYRKTGFIEEGRKVREVKFADGSYDDMVCMYRFVKAGVK
jgi:ribosomal protein S18 acetylase RimI-like enzyme